ncbi:D-aminoacyl-tRNA deacylase [Lederbergia galactosidilytica]|uniref:D-aminoacyl-tRNA deacylase n=1 Tax=Lederbergia galactosidilytica TaxID=217031 RepID=A0A0Q9Y2E3_9BACI|nr:D-aminoacyl-tRNA deacylase [Lederbergia galactosidilytica]KRG10894.1 D-tyrosyl-tRNA(Tyr) deacylase [Lederbergia galactosidilytica]KRG13291.1 D-tyrosyl-tRNA(Tyr) deacylase [Virgibacillus soli]MBP1914889.1 D-tyrosyl-tRNA(Tyr) deacylase [Lederbergia galactosidilytica]OAK74180.1 D-tyrosyl-tRNA(Tyr) deacylase [Lederbergia galactosidilytica]
MKVVLQRCKKANVTVNEEVVGEIGRGFMLLVGFQEGDTEQTCDWMAEKIIHLRVFEDENEKMNRSLLDEEGSILSVSQFTLYGDCTKGRRPNFMKAAKPEEAEALYEYFNKALRDKGVPIATGIFGEMMDVSLVNEGPVTLILEK